MTAASCSSSPPTSVLRAAPSTPASTLFSATSPATGNTDVTLTVEELNVLNGSTLVSPVENGVVKSVSGVSVSGTSSVTTGSEPVTQPTTPVGGSLTVNGTSNLFKQASATFDNSTNKVTVTYQLKSSVKLIDSEWKLTYDTSKLTLDTLAMPKTNNAEYGGTEGAKTGNFADPNLIEPSTSMSSTSALPSIPATRQSLLIW